jgi:perosamine synthetase
MNEIEKEFIPVNDIKLSELEIKYAEDALKTGFISGLAGKYIKMFEDKCAEFCNAKYGVACSNGTTALHLAVRVAGIKNGDEVLVNTFTNIPTVLSIMWNGGTPVLVDSRKDTWAMDEKDIEDKITEKTKAIMPVHIYGHPAKMDVIMKIADNYGLTVIEDSAEAFGATVNGKPVGSIGDMGCFSFLAGKMITSGEGGMVLTNNEQFAEKLRSLRGHAFGTGIDRYMHVDLGYNFRLSNLQAAVGLGQIERANELIEFRRRISSWYNERLKGVEGFTLPVELPWAKNVYCMYGILVGESFGMDRNGLMTELKKQGIDTRAFFVPMHQQRVFHERGMFINESHPVSEYLGSHGLYLPAGVTMTEEKADRICNAIKALSGR